MWLAVSPILFAGVLTGHALAYRLTGVSTGSMHAYLDHAPQVLLVAGIAGVLLAGLTARTPRPSARPFAVAALAIFAVQEHVERLAHTGELPWLLASPPFLVGLLLQLPFALAAWALARALLAALDEERSRRPRVPRLFLPVAVPAARSLAPVPARVGRGRAPPRFRRP